MTQHNTPPELPVRREPLAPPAIPLRRRAVRLFLRAWPAIVWGAALAGAIWLYTGLTAHGEAIAYEAIVELRASPSVPGRVATLAVQPGDVVRAGQAVATLDASDVDARLRLAATRLERARSRLDAMCASLDTKTEDRRVKAAARRADHESEGRRLRASLDELIADEAADRAELSALEPQIARLQPLAEDSMITPDRLEALVRQRTVLDSRVASVEGRIARARLELASWAELAPEDAIVSDMEAQLAPFEVEIESQEARVAELMLEREKYAVVAPGDGIVQRISIRPGEWLDAGAEIAAIVVAVPGRATAFVHAEHARRVETGMVATLLPRDRRGLPVEGAVVAIGARIELIPEQLRTIASVPEWGRRVSISIANPRPPLPGEVYTVSFR